MPISVHEAKTHLSRLLTRVDAGEDVIIARYGRPVARLVPIRRPAGPRRLGSLKGRIRIAPDFDSPLPSKIMNNLTGGT